MPKPRGISGLNTSACIGKQSFLPPKSPGPVIPPSYVDYNFGHCIGHIGIPRPNENSRHQHTSSESVLEDEQLSWLDDLLNEPEPLIRKGAHRRSSSDSFAYVDMCNLSSNLDNIAYANFRNHNIAPKPSCGLEAFGHLNGLEHPYCINSDSFKMQQNRRNELAFNTVNNPCSSTTTNEPEALTSDEQDQGESPQGMHISSEKREESHAMQVQDEMETKRVKQQFAQRSRVRKLQYISELERSVQAFQAEGLGMAAEIEFLSQQSLILSLENKALKQRFDSLSQEQHLKGFEQEMLEREIARLRSVFQHRQLQLHRPKKQPQRQRHQQSPNLSQKRKDARSVARDSPPQINHP